MQYSAYDPDVDLEIQTLSPSYIFFTFYPTTITIPEPSFPGIKGS